MQLPLFNDTQALKMLKSRSLEQIHQKHLNVAQNYDALAGIPKKLLNMWH